MRLTRKIEVGNSIHVKDHTLVPIEESSILHDPDKERCWWYGSKRLIAFVIQSPSGIQAYNAAAGRITIQEVKQIVPDIENCLNDHS